VFDHHNGLTPAQHLLFPYSIPEAFLPSLWQWKEDKALVVLSASTNLKVTNNNKWPLFTMNMGFNEEELNAWFKHEGFFPAVDDKADIVYWTNSMPYLLHAPFLPSFLSPNIFFLIFLPLELSLLLKVACDNGGILGDETVLNQVIALYTTERNQEYTALQMHFENEFCKTDADMQTHINTLVWMNLGVSWPHGTYIMLNQQFMFLDKDKVKAITPHVQKNLIHRYEKICFPPLPKSFPYLNFLQTYDNIQKVF
jgi:hypothetical protein